MIKYLHVEPKAIQNTSILKQNKEYFFSTTHIQLTKYHQLHDANSERKRFPSVRKKN